MKFLEYDIVFDAIAACEQCLPHIVYHLALKVCIVCMLLMKFLTIGLAINWHWCSLVRRSEGWQSTKLSNLCHPCTSCDIMTYIHV